MIANTWQTWATVVTTIAVPVITAYGAVALKRVSKRTEEATAHKTEVEAQAGEVGIARGLLDDVRKMYAEQRTVNVEDKMRHEAQIAALQERLTAVQEDQAVTDRKLTILLTELAGHQPWDAAAYAALSAANDNYPPPPPFGSAPSNNNKAGG